MASEPVVDGCDLCGDQGPLLLLPRCHMTAPLAAEIDGDILTLRCYLPTCKGLVARFRVAELLKKMEVKNGE